MILKNIFLSWWIIVLGKTMENVREDRDIKLVRTEGRRNCFMSELNYHTAKFFTEYLLAIEMKKAETLINKPTLD